MNFRTEITIPPSKFHINHQSKILMFGSCFVENIGKYLLKYKFKIDINPFGILYNPLSINRAISYGLGEATFSSEDVFEYKGIYHSFMHHSDFSATSQTECIDKINSSLQTMKQNVSSYDFLFITFGTAYIFEEKNTGKIVSNCHKLPATLFDRRRIDVAEIVESWKNLISDIRKKNPDIKFIFTVSPIRHLSDGAHENQLSKAILLLAIEKLEEMLPEVFYFPAYELLMDDLRDYRFYAPDMVHPSTSAVEYITEKFASTYFDNETKETLNKWSALQRSIDHKPFNEDSEEHQQFLKQTLLKLYDFSDKYPYFDCKKEIALLKSKIY